MNSMTSTFHRISATQIVCLETGAVYTLDTQRGVVECSVVSTPSLPESVWQQLDAFAPMPAPVKEVEPPVKSTPKRSAKRKTSDRNIQ